MRKNILNWMKLSSFIFALSSLFASCSNEFDEALQPAGNGNLQFVISDFPAFGEDGQTRAIGFPNVGKTGWADNDAIFVSLYSKEYGLQTVQINYQNGVWTPDGEVKLTYLKDETPTITALYAPSYSLDGTVKLKNNMKPGMDEYIETTDCTIVDGEIKINFKDAERSYSRLRFATMPGASLTVEFTGGFIPAGASEVTSTQYSLTTDDDGNAYLYGIFAANATVTATAQHEIYPKEGITTTCTFHKQSTSGKSYALGVKLGDTVDAKLAFIGDVALKDGSFVSNYNIAQMTDAQKDAMAGIVFMTTVESITYDRIYPAKLTDDKVMNADFPHCTNGLIVSLTNTDEMAWQGTSVIEYESVYEDFQNTDHFKPTNVDKSKYAPIIGNKKSTTATEYLNTILGYNNTKILEAYNDYCNSNNKTQYVVKPVEALSSFAESNPAPFGSTGWYLPSAKELYMLCDKDVDNIENASGTYNKQFLYGILSDTNISGDPFTESYYWSSTEFSEYLAVAINFNEGKYKGERKILDYTVRYVCAF